MVVRFFIFNSNRGRKPGAAIGAKYVDYKKKVKGRIIPGMPI
jgi:hypothetical protein